MAKYIFKAFFLTTFPSTQQKCPKIYAVTLVLPLKEMREMENVNLQKENSCLGAEGDGLLE